MARAVLLLNSSSIGYGADRQLASIALGLDPARYRPVVVLPDPGRIGPMLEGAGVEVRYAEPATLRRDLIRGRAVISTARRLIRNRRELADIVRDTKASILHTNTSIVLAGMPAARAAGIPHVLHVREIYGRSPGPAAALWPMLRRRILGADLVLAVSAAAAGQFGAAENVRVVYDGIEPRPGDLDRASARRALGLSRDRFAVAMVGRISDWKGQDVLARALALEPLASIGAIGLISGDAAPGQEHFERELKALGHQLGLGDRLRLLGYRDDVATVHAAADAFAAPSIHSDPLPNAILEAALAGLPVVGTSDGGGISEIIHDPMTGLIVAADNPRELASALAELAADPAGARLMGARAKKDVAARFRMDSMLEGIQSAYDEVLA